MGHAESSGATGGIVRPKVAAVMMFGDCTGLRPVCLERLTVRGVQRSGKMRVVGKMQGMGFLQTAAAANAKLKLTGMAGHPGQNGGFIGH